MPKSRVRKKKVYTPPADLSPGQAAAAAQKRPSPVWVPALAVGLLVFAIAWLVLYYLTSGFMDLPESVFKPVQKIGFWNLGIGFGAMIGSLLLLSRWR